MKRQAIITILGMAATAVLLASGSARASDITHQTHAASADEHISGVVYGATVLADTLTFPLQWRGLVDQSSEFTLPSGGSPSATLPSRLGSLGIDLTSNFTFQVRYMNSSTCYVIGQTSGAITVDGATSTGAFKDATGTGTLTETLGAFRPKNPDGSCNIFGNLTDPRGAFDALTIEIAPLTIEEP